MPEHTEAGKELLAALEKAKDSIAQLDIPIEDCTVDDLHQTVAEIANGGEFILNGKYRTIKTAVEHGYLVCISKNHFSVCRLKGADDD